MRILIAFLVLAAPGICAIAAEPASGSDAELVRMESAKWDPSSLADPVALLSMFSGDMLSVDPGADLHGGVERRTWADLLAYGPLPSWKAKLSDWRVLHPGPGVVLLSYQVSVASERWKGYATSIWARRDGKWKTVFYQVSTAQ